MIDREEVTRRFRESDPAARAAVQYRNLEGIYHNKMATVTVVGPALTESEIYQLSVEASLVKREMGEVILDNGLIIADNNPKKRAGEFVLYDSFQYRLEANRDDKLPNKGDKVIIKHSSVAVAVDGEIVPLLETVVSPIPPYFSAPQEFKD